MNLFDRRAEMWDNDPARIERALAVAEKIKARIPLSGEMEAMEFGCGTGLLSFILQPYLGHITLVDNSDGMIEVLSRKIKDAGVENMTPWKVDLTVDDHSGRKFDLIYALMSLHHVADTGKILRVFGDMLREGGYLCVADIYKSDVPFHPFEFDGHDGYIREELERELVRAGFREIHFEECLRIIRDRDGEKREFPVFLMTCVNGI